MYFVKKFRQAKKDMPIVVGGYVGELIKEIWEEHYPVEYLVESEGEVAEPGSRATDFCVLS